MKHLTLTTIFLLISLVAMGQNKDTTTLSGLIATGTIVANSGMLNTYKRDTVRCWFKELQVTDTITERWVHGYACQATYISENSYFSQTLNPITYVESYLMPDRKTKSIYQVIYSITK